MDTALGQLVALASRPISSAPPGLTPGVRRLAGPLGEELESMLSVKNGFFAYGTALHVFPACTTTDSHTLYEWNLPSLWKAEYGDLFTDVLCFAEDIFAEQFVIRDGVVCRFDPETAEFTPMADSLEAWAQLILDEPETETGWTTASAWKNAHGTVPLGRRLAPKIPFVTGGEFEISNLFVCDPVERLRFNADLAAKIRDLPDGAQIEFVAVD